jgi:hypothetical protein
VREHQPMQVLQRGQQSAASGGGKISDTSRDQCKR